jgi:putative membrane protein
MTWIATGAILLVALLHAWFLVTEMFLWQTPTTRRVFGTTAEFARASAALAANQGLYNGFLAAGLLWSLAAYGPIEGRPILSFFLGCVVVAGVFGAATANKRILWVQAVPGVVALALLWLL